MLFIQGDQKIPVCFIIISSTGSGLFTVDHTDAFCSMLVNIFPSLNHLRQAFLSELPFAVQSWIFIYLF